MTKPKVLITNFHPGDGGGHTTYINRLLAAGLMDHFDLALAVPESSRLFTSARQYKNVRVFPCNFPGSVRELPAVLHAVRGLGEIFRAFPFQAIHCNGGRDHAIAVWWKGASRNRVKIVRTHHAIRQLSNDFYHRWFHHRLTDLHIYVAHAQRNINEAGNASRCSASVVIANGLDLAAYTPAPKCDRILRELGIQPDQMVFGSVGGVARHKRVDIMLRAVAGMAERERVVIVALGGEKGGRQLEELAGNLGVRHQFRYAGLHADVRPYISIFDVGFLLSNSIETASFAAREMMAMGVPLICSGYSGLLEVVEEGRNGFIAATDNVGEVVAGMRNFLQMRPGQLKQFGQAAREKAVRCFGQELMIQKTCTAYNQMIEG